MIGSGSFHLHCPPGTRMILDVRGMPDKLITACVGHARKRFVVVQMPALPEAGRDAFYQMLYPDNEVIVRFLYEGTVVGFSARLIKCIQIPFPLVFLTYQKKLESHDLRKHRRVPCCIPGQGVLGTEALPGMITDLSLSGCQFSAAFDGPQPTLAIDDTMDLRCELFGRDAQGHLACSVKRVSLSSKRLEIGLKFREVPPQTQDALRGYLQEALSILG